MSPMNHEIEDGYAAARAAMSADGYASAQRQMLDVRFGEKASAVVLGERLQEALERVGPVGAWAPGESGVGAPEGRIAATDEHFARGWIQPPAVTTSAFEPGDLIEELPPDFYPDPREDHDEVETPVSGSRARVRMIPSRPPRTRTSPRQRCPWC